MELPAKIPSQRMLIPCLCQDGFHGQIWREQNTPVTKEIQHHLWDGKLTSVKKHHTNLKDGRVCVDEECAINHSGRRQRWCGVKHPAEDGIRFGGESRPGRPEQAATNVQGYHLSLAHCYPVQFFRFWLESFSWCADSIGVGGHILNCNRWERIWKWIHPITRGRQFIFHIVTDITIGQEQANNKISTQIL